MNKRTTVESLREKISRVFFCMGKKEPKQEKKEEEKPYVDVTVRKYGRDVRITFTKEEINKIYADAMKSVMETNGI